MATYYIATTGSDSNPGTLSQPFATFYKIGSLSLVAGDIVYIRAGTYLSGRTSGGNGFNISGKSGSSGNPITISAYPADFPSGGRVVLDCTDYLGTSSFYGANIDNCPWFVFSGIRIKGVPQRVAGQINPGWLVTGGCDNTILENCEADSCGYSGFMLGDSDNVTYLNCDSHGNDNPMDTGVQKHGGADGFARTGSANTSTNTHYIGCRSWFNADDGWDCFDTNGTIHYENCWAFWNGYRNNIFPLSHCSGTDCWGDGNGFKLGGSGTNVTGSTTRFLSNCLAFENYANGFDQNAAHMIAEVYNNTAYSNGDIAFAFGYYAGLAHVIKNNISYLNGQDIPITSNVDDWIQSNNSWNPGFSVSGSDFESLSHTGVNGVRQPDGSLPFLNFLRLTSGSIQIDAGVDVGLPFNDAAPDLGAFEFGEELGSPGSSTQTVITVDYTPCDPAPDEGYNILYRVVGETTYQDAGFFTTSPAAINTGAIYPDGTDFEGVIKSDCGDVAWTTVVPDDGEGDGECTCRFAVEGEDDFATQPRYFSFEDAPDRNFVVDLSSTDNIHEFHVLANNVFEGEPTTDFSVNQFMVQSLMTIEGESISRIQQTSTDINSIVTKEDGNKEAQIDIAQNGEGDVEAIMSSSTSDINHVNSIHVKPYATELGVSTSHGKPLHIYNNTVVTPAAVTGGVVLYAAGGVGASELHVIDEAGNDTTLSPHNFSGIPEGQSDEMAWSYYCEKNGEYINVDMLRVIRKLEELTGEKFIYQGHK